MSGSSFNRGPAYGFSAEVKSKVSVHGVELSANESLALCYYTDTVKYIIEYLFYL